MAQNTMPPQQPRAATLAPKEVPQNPVCAPPPQKAAAFLLPTTRPSVPRCAAPAAGPNYYVLSHPALLELESKQQALPPFQASFWRFRECLFPAADHAHFKLVSGVLGSFQRRRRRPRRPRSRHQSRRRRPRCPRGRASRPTNSRPLSG